MNNKLPSLGIYGPSDSDNSGVNSYIQSSLQHLKSEYRISIVSNHSKWIDPNSFDVVLYHLGNNSMHHSAFKALRLRAGLSILHEYLVLDYYFQMHHEIDDDTYSSILFKLNQKANIQASSFPEFIEIATKEKCIDPYSIDIGVEEFSVCHATTVAVHSPSVRSLLQKRYPKSQVKSIPFPVNSHVQDPERRFVQSLGIKDDQFVFGCFGFIGEYKRIPWLLEAWCSWENRPQNAQLLLVGKRQIDLDYDLDGVIEVGYVDDKLFHGILSDIDCGIQLRYPSLGETSGPAASLVSHSKPAILSDTPEMRDLKGDERTLYVKSDRHIIKNLIAAMQSQYKSGQRKHSIFRTEFSWENWRTQILSLLMQSQLS